VSVQGGGGGKKVPPGGTPPTAGRPIKPPTVAKSAPKIDLPAAEPPKADAKKTDSFEVQRFKSTAEVHKLDEAFAHAATPSGIDNLVRLLDASRAQLAAEHRVLREQARSVVELLVKSGFAPAQLEKAKAELVELRKRMAALRKRLQHLQRRLKSAFASAGKTGDASFAKTLGAQLERLKNLEPGMSRAMLALQTIEQAYGTFSDGSTPVLRLDVSRASGDERRATGDAMSVAAPGASIAEMTLGLLRGSETSAWSTPRPKPVPAPLEGTAALGDALLPPREPG
jgi:hypothetical protein